MTEVFKGATDQTFYFKMVDSTAGTPETGLTITNIDATYTRNRAAAVKNDLTALAAVDTAHTDNKGIEIDATNSPGLYRVDFPDAAFATGVDKVILNLTCTGCDPAYIHIDLVNVNNQVAYVPNAAADAAGGLPISDAGGLDLDALRADAAAILLDTGTTLDARIPAALVGGRMDSSAGAMAANVMTAAAAAADLTTELQSGLATAAAVAALSIPTAIQNADAYLDRADAIETGVTPRGLSRLLGAVMVGKLSGAGTGTEVFRNTVVDSKDRITATVDGSGNRTSITADQT